jgi:hypothetical protein
MKKTFEEQLEELQDIIQECADAIDALAQNSHAQISTDDMEQPEAVIYGIPSNYAIAAFRQRQQDARIKLIDLQKQAGK